MQTMVEPHWTSYVGMISGLIGAVSGIAGAIMGYIGYRKASSLKSLDMRLELRRAATDLTTSYAALNDLIDSANQSRIKMSAATGKFGSGDMDIWNNELEADKAAIAQIGETIPTGNEEYKDSNTKELEAKLVDVHRMQGEVTQLINKYNTAMRKDEKRGDHLREDMRSRIRSEHPKSR